MDINDSNYVLGEEEAIWLLKLVLPYVNELLLKLKALFSGDPSTTMKVIFFLFFTIFFSLVINEVMKKKKKFLFLCVNTKRMTNCGIAYDNGSWQYFSLFWQGVAAA